MPKTKPSKNEIKLSFEAKHNLRGFLDLLFKIDKRNNPQNYQKSNNYIYDYQRIANNTHQSQ
jgi:hypothetical protein